MAGRGGCLDGTEEQAGASIAGYATEGQKDRAIDLLARIVDGEGSDAEAFAALDEAFDLVEEVRASGEAREG